MVSKPKVKLTGKDGNVFNLMGICSKALKRAGQHAEAAQMFKRITEEAHSYDAALVIMMEYCDVS